MWGIWVGCLCALRAPPTPKALQVVTSSLLPLALSILSGLLVGLAWLMPGTAVSALLGWLACASLVYTLRLSKSPYKHLYISGLVSNTIGFHWLAHTISYFGGFGWVAGLLIFSLFVVLSSVQYLVFVLFYRALPARAHSYAIGTAVAWCASEFLSIRICPWMIGHTQLSFTWLAQIADIGGVLLISFLMFWIVEACLRATIARERNALFALPVLTLLVALRYGAVRTEQYSMIGGATQKVAVVQANVSIEEKHDQRLLAANVERYAELSKAIPGPETLIIWPETVISEFIDASVGSVANDPRLPFFSSNNPLLVGALTYESRERIFNSALAILNSGSVLRPYHKQILMPFGEYTPFGDIFPWMRELNATAANFTPGSGVKVFEYPMTRNDDSSYSLKLSPLICYEDIVPSLSRLSVLAGAELLVNLTNDAWFGDSVAPRQHNLIASFRAIENRRYLIRSTNTGLTAIVNPLGQTTSQLPPFGEGTLLAEVHPMSYMTVYTEFVGDALGEVLGALSLLSLLYQFAVRRKWIN